LFLPSLAFAVDMEFYTYGGFDAVVNAFVQLVMIFGNSSYQTLYYSAVVCGIAGGATIAIVKLVSGMQSNILGWAPIAALGMAIYIGLFVPKGNLTIYDPVYNRFQTVPNVPNGVVIIAGTMNAIERGLVDIVSNSASPDAFQTQAGGKGFLGLFNLVTTPITATDTNLDASMTRYIDDCAGFALNNSSSGLTVNELRKNTTSFSTSLAKAANPANFTVFYNTANPNGQTMTCQAAWTAITTAMTATALQGSTNAQCSTLGFDVTSAAERIQCQTMLFTSQNVSALGAPSWDAFVQQAYIAQKLDYVFRSGDGTAATNYQFMMNASGSMKAANDWLPILRAVLTAIAVALIPFLCIFLPTPICGRVLGMMFGLFVWLTTWGVTDAIMHQFAMNHAYKLMEQVRQCQLGMDAFLFFPTQAAKTLSMFGTMRMGGLVLATALSGMLVKFGGHAMAMLAGNITGQIQGAGVKGETQTADPSARAQSIVSNTSAMPTQAWANGHQWNARTGEAWAKMDSGTASFENMSAELGGAGGISRMMANANTARTVDFGTKGGAMEQAGLANSAQALEFGHSANMAQLFDTKAAFGGNAEELGKARAAMEKSIATVADRIGWKASDLSLATREFARAGAFAEMSSVKAMTGAADWIAAGGDAGRGKGFAAVASSARADQIRAAANHAAPESWRNDAALWDSVKKELTPLGIAKFVAAMQSVGIEYGTKYGHETMDLGSDGKVARISAVGTVPGSDRAELEKFAAQLDGADMHNEAGAVRRMAAKGKSFTFGISYDRRGGVVGFEGGRGGTFTSSDKDVTDTGRLREYTNLDRSTTGRQSWSGSRVVREDTDLSVVDKGLRSTVGTFMKSGYSNENFNLMSNVGAYKLSIDGKEQWVQGEWFYANDNQTGKNVVVGGAFKNGMDGNVLMFKQGEDGALHYAQVQGKYDSKGRLVAGGASEVTRTQFVESIKDNKGNSAGMGVVERQGAPGVHSVAVNAQGGKHVDMTSTFSFGTSVQSHQTLAGSAAQGEFEQGNQLGVGGAATNIAIGERSIAVGAEKVGQATTLVTGARMPRTMSRENTRWTESRADRAARNSENAVKEREQKIQKNSQRQAQIGRANPSNLPRPGAPRNHGGKR
jgi:conjugal transfer mating pair stabilization protein TraG